MSSGPLKENTVVTAFDDNYVYPFLVMAHTAMKHSYRKFKLKIAFDETQLSEKNLNLISNVLSILDIEFELIPIKLGLDLKPQDYISVTSFARLYLAETLSEEFLWLDCDLICRRGWDEIFVEYESALKESTVCASVDAIPLQKLLGGERNMRNSAMLRMGENYFNSGVLLVNPGRWKDLNIVTNWKDIYSQNEQLGFQYADQDIINFMCFKSFRHLDPAYNVFATIGSNYVLNDDIKILHFPGKDKPWTFQKYSLAILLSAIRLRYFFEYFKVQSEMIKSVRKIDPSLASDLKILHRGLQIKRSAAYVLCKIFKKLIRLRML